MPPIFIAVNWVTFSNECDYIVTNHGDVIPGFLDVRIIEISEQCTILDIVIRAYGPSGTILNTGYLQQPGNIFTK